MACDPVLYQLAEYLHEEAMAEREQEAFDVFCEERDLDPDAPDSRSEWAEHLFWEGFTEPDPDAGYDPDWAENYN